MHFEHILCQNISTLTHYTSSFKNAGRMVYLIIFNHISATFVHRHIVNVMQVIKLQFAVNEGNKYHNC